MSDTNPLGSNQVLKRTFLFRTDTLPDRLAVESVSGLLPSLSYDAVTVSYPDPTTEVFEFREGGVSGTILSTLTLTYTDSTKENLSTVVST